jgi:hypothetical protein
MYFSWVILYLAECLNSSAAIGKHENQTGCLSPSDGASCSLLGSFGFVKDVTLLRSRQETYKAYSYHTQNSASSGRSHQTTCET